MQHELSTSSFRLYLKLMGSKTISLLFHDEFQGSFPASDFLHTLVTALPCPTELPEKLMLDTFQGCRESRRRRDLAATRPGEFTAPIVNMNISCRSCTQSHSVSLSSH